MRLQVPGSESIVNVGTQKQLFIDDYIIETTRWITPRRAEAARWIQAPSWHPDDPLSKSTARQSALNPPSFALDNIGTDLTSP